MRDAFENKTETITFTVEEATMNKLREAFEDVKVNACPWFDVQDRYGNAARYYREDVNRAIKQRLADKKKEIRRLRELAARILGKYEEEKKKQLAAVRLASLRGIERDRAKELQARTEREIENLRKEIKGE